MRRIALALTIAFTVALGAAPAEGKVPSQRVTHYELTRAEGTVKLTFRGDEAAGCRERGLCAISGTTTYSFGGKLDFGQVFWAKQRKRTIAFYGFFDAARGESVSDVVSEGSAEHCVDRRRVFSDSIEFEPRSKRVRFTWRRERDPDQDGVIIGADDTVFDTRCAGPELEDLAASNAFPRADVPYRVFRSPRSSFRTTGTLPFAGGGFAGTVEWDLSYALRYRGNRGGGWFAAASAR
jgi:hypothetical protein